MIRDDTKETNHGLTKLPNINKMKASADRRVTKDGVTQLHHIMKIKAHCMFACWWLIVLMSADRQTDKKTYRLTDRQTGRETYRQTDRQTDIQTVPFP